MAENKSVLARRWIFKEEKRIVEILLGAVSLVGPSDGREICCRGYEWEKIPAQVLRLRILDQAQIVGVPVACVLLKKVSV